MADKKKANDKPEVDLSKVDGNPEATNPHPVDEDPEDHIGDELPDPWVTADDAGNWKDVTGVDSE